MLYKKNALLALLIPVLTACGSSSLKSPTFSEVYSFCIHGDAAQKDSAKNDVKSCKPRPTDGNTGVAQEVSLAAEAARKFGAQQAMRADQAAEFRFSTDTTALAAVSGAAIGVATNAHSDLYKATAAIAGTALGLKAYANPSLQSSLYAKSSSASRCIYRSLSELAVLLPENLTYRTLISNLDVIDKNRSQLNTVLYNQDYLANLKTLEPAESYAIYRQALNADTDAEAKKEAVNFLLSIDLVTEDKLFEITEKQILALNDGAFKVEEAIKKIPELGKTPVDLLATISTKSAFIASPEADIPYTKVLETKAALDACVNKVQP
ncbi:hypothetical protein [Pseudomonas batumici]|uniref:hypothetical protein n=1 Tax=Pseudomonas batumici TaxID=226910 RepID=UPI00058A3C1C|nr:hypothetical protein [Pseudomonas batumici]